MVVVLKNNLAKCTVLLLIIGLLTSVRTAHFAQASFIPQAEPRSQLQVTAQLSLSPSQPTIGQAVTAQFSIKNTSQSTIFLQQVGAGGRGPNCEEWACSRFADFPLDSAISIAPNQTYSYQASRLFWDGGSYFAQPVYQDAGGTWYFTGNRVNYTVGESLSVSEPLTFSSMSPAQGRLVFANFTLRNDGSSPLHFQRVGIGTRGPNCVHLDWTCARIEEFPYERNVTLQPGEARSFEMWRDFVEQGTYFGQISVQDSADVWHRLGSPLDFTVQPPQRTQRLTPWQMGVHYHPVWNPDDVTRLRLAQSVGIDIIRIAVSWQMLEPDHKGDWANEWYIPRLGEVVETANALGIDVYFMVQNTPCWASSDPNRDCAGKRWNPTYPPRSSDDYADAMRKLVRLFGDDVVAWEIWNEPNTSRFWSPVPDPQQYVNLLQAAHQAIKSADASATVLAGSIAGADIEFLIDLYDAGAKDYFDALALHPYSGTNAPYDCAIVRASYACGVEVIRDMMLHFDDAKPIWLTEFGWSSYHASGGVNMNAQRDYLQQSLDLVNTWDYVPVATWYNLIDTNSSSGVLEFEDHMGLFDTNYVPKPSGLSLPYPIFDPSTLTEKLFLPVTSK